MKIVVRISEDAEKVFRRVGKEIDLDGASRLYSFKTKERGNALNLFGGPGYDNGIGLSVSMKNKGAVENPIFRLVLETNRGNKYMASAAWYQMVILFPEDK